MDPKEKCNYIQISSAIIAESGILSYVLPSKYKDDDVIRFELT